MFSKCSVCKQSLQWGCIIGLVAGVYSGMTYGMQETHGVHELGNDIYAIKFTIVVKRYIGKSSDGFVIHL